MLKNEFQTNINHQSTVIAFTIVIVIGAPRRKKAMFSGTTLEPSKGLPTACSETGLWGPQPTRANICTDHVSWAWKTWLEIKLNPVLLIRPSEIGLIEEQPPEPWLPALGCCSWFKWTGSPVQLTWEVSESHSYLRLSVVFNLMSHLPKVRDLCVEQKMMATVSAGVNPELFLGETGRSFTNTCTKSQAYPIVYARLHVSILLISPGDRGYCGPKRIALSGFLLRELAFLCPVIKV